MLLMIRRVRTINSGDVRPSGEHLISCLFYIFLIPFVALDLNVNRELRQKTHRPTS